MSNQLQDLLDQLSKDPEFLAEWNRQKVGCDKLISLIRESSKRGRSVQIEEREDESYLIYDPVMYITGVGETLEEAVDDYVHWLKELGEKWEWEDEPLKR